MYGRIILVMFVALALSVARVAAHEVTVPLQLDDDFLRENLVAQMYTDPEGTARVWDDGQGCNSLVLSDPHVVSDTGTIRVTSTAKARVGFAFGIGCLPIFDWAGTVEVIEAPSVDPLQPIVRFHVIDSNLYGPDTRKSLTGTLWDWVKQYVHPRLQAVTVDLHSAITELRALLPLVIPSEDAARTQQLLDSISLKAVDTRTGGVSATVRFDVPDRPAGYLQPAPAPTLTPEELRQWEGAWQGWDAFVTFIAKQAAHDTTARELRQALLDVLLEARYDLLEALVPTTPGAPDPVRPLFLRSWERLAPVLRRLQTGLPGETTLRYLSFIAAGDALRAIDELGPDSGLDISADGLRRLARILAPTSTQDPLVYELVVDPELRQLFGFGPPLSPPTDRPTVALSGWFFRPAWAVSGPDAGLVARLNGWVPTHNELANYLLLMRDLLNETSRHTITGSELENRFHEIYRWLVLATAWQESCWRQFIRDGSDITPLVSSAGSVGLMQINQHVWRGFYDIAGLHEDVGYNARAGSEILLHYLQDHAIAKGEHMSTGDINNLARATYAVYHGGPGHLRRYRSQKTKRSLRKIDAAFWSKYRAVQAGQELVVAQCFSA